MKNIKYLLFIIICLFLFGGLVKADDDFGPGQTKILMTFDEEHKDPKCTVTKGDLSSSPYTMYPSNGETTSGSSITLKYNKNVTSTGEVVIKCEYKSIHHSEVLDKTYYFQYGVEGEVASGDLYFNLDNYDKSSFDVAGELGLKTVVSFTLNDTDGILKKNCSGSTCVVSINEGYNQLGTYRIDGTIVYKKMFGDIEAEVTTKVIIDVYNSSSGALIISKGYGTCDTPNSSDWTRTSTSSSEDRYASKQLGNLSVPNCTPRTENNPLLEFKGWVAQKNSDSSSGSSVQGIHSCTRYNPQKGSMNIQGGHSYFACYDYGHGIIVYGSGKTVNVDSTWHSFTTANSYYKMSESKIELPSVTMEGEFSQNQKVQWKNIQTGKIYDAGDLVDPDGSQYILQVETTITYRNYYKSIYANEAYKLNPSDGKVTGCSSANENYIKNVGSGECILMGSQSTDDYIDVTVFGENGYQRVFHVRVVSRNGLSESGDEAFVINVTPNIVASLSDSGTLNNYFIETCDSFTLAGTSEVGSDPTGTNILEYNYSPSGCGYGGEYLSYCIDAGRTGPLPKDGITYTKSETIDMNSDFGKLITYMGRMGMYTHNDQDVEDVTTLVRIVGIINNLTVASQYNSQDLAHAGSYQFYKGIADAIVVNGRIDPDKVDAVGGINTRVKTVLKEYQNVEDYTGSNFERTIDNIIYSEITAEGDYWVSYEGLMIIPGDSATLSPPSSISGTVDKFEKVSGDREVNGRTTYEYKVTITGNVNTTTLPTKGSEGSAVTDKIKPYCFKLTVTSGGQAKDVFITEPAGRAAGDGYQRMISVNTSEPTLYVYFSAAPSVKACGGLAALDPANAGSSSFNESLFRAAGCCNMPALDQTFLDEHCSNSCISTTLGSVCDYRPNFDIENPVADYYTINEGQRSNGEYKIGSGPGSECIVKTDDMGWSRANGMELDSSVNKFDDAGNSLMVDSYKNNRYCRVSCSENWQLSMEAFGNFVGDRAIAAGSYFSVNDSDMFVSGKRTCYTTFINYGNPNTEREIGKGDEGFTRDVSDESDIINENYNRYSNLSHVYADLACENDGEYTTSGGHTVKCDYSSMYAHGWKFCYHAYLKYYCLTGSVDQEREAGGKCLFYNYAWHEKYCPEDDGYSVNGAASNEECKRTWTASSSDNWDYSKTADPDENNNCPSGYKWGVDPDDEDEEKLCYGHSISYSCGDPDDYKKKRSGRTGTTCWKVISMLDYYSCTEKRDGTHLDDWEPAAALQKHMKNMSDGQWSDGYESLNRLDDPFGYTFSQYYYAKNVPDIAFEKGNDQPQTWLSHPVCGYEYPVLSYNKCFAIGYAACIQYQLSTTNKVDDGDEADDGHGGMTPTDPGQYVKYTPDTQDNLLNPETHPKAENVKYDHIFSFAGQGQVRGLATGGFNNGAFTSYAYVTNGQARLELANDTPSSYSEYRSWRLANVDDYDDMAADGGISGWSNTKYRLVSSPEEFCYSASGGTYTSENLSWTPAATSVVDKKALSSSAGPVVITGLTYGEVCDKSYPNCWYKKGGSDGDRVAYIAGNHTPDALATETALAGMGNYLNWFEEKAEEAKAAAAQQEGASETGCPASTTCDTPRSLVVRHDMLENGGFKDTLAGFAQSMMAANGRIITYSKDMFACQHFELYNATDGENNERKNNTLWASNFMGTRRSFTRIVSAFEPEISYSYDEAEYMTLLNNDNIMERFGDLNDQTYGCYDIVTRSGEHGCYNNSTNKKVTTSIQRYAAGEQVGSPVNVELSRNYTENYYYDKHNEAWPNGSAQAKSYGAEGESVAPLTCSGDDCNIGDQLGPVNMYKRTLFCSIGLVNDEPVLSSHSDGKSSSLFSVYVNDKDYFWTGGTCFINQVQYIKANYIKASIENSSFYKNKGYWYVNNSNDAKAHGDNLVNALENSNEILKATYNTRDEVELGAWSVEGGYNVFPIKLTTPRDLYTYRYQFSQIGSYGDGKLGRVMGTDQSLIAVNERACFYEVFEELCLCCGNPINSHTMSDAPYEFVATSSAEYEMSLTDNTLVPSATIAINTSTISLSDMQSDSDRELGNNWSEESLFFYDGNTFTTNKGELLLHEIQAEGRGDNIYSETPEYRFIINPQGMSEIRKYNDDHGYGVNYDTMKSTGRYAIMPFDGETYLSCTDLSQCEWEIPGTTDEDNFPQNRIINFTHFRSEYLLETLREEKYNGKVNYTGKYSNDEIGVNTECYVTKNNVSSIHDMAEQCRWVDFLQQDEDTGMYYRLAYK